MTAAAKPKKNIRLVCGVFFADVVTDKRSNPPIHHWIVQREGSPDIVYWGQDTTLAAAQDSAMAFLNDLAEQDKKKA